MDGVSVLTCGVWDLFHQGHVRLLQRARQFGLLTVGVQDDVHAVKSHPVQPAHVRFRQVEESGLAVRTVLYGSGTDGQVLRDVRPDVYVHGDDWHSQADRSQVLKVAEDIGCRIVLLPRTQGVSSTLLRSGGQTSATWTG